MWKDKFHGNLEAIVSSDNREQDGSIFNILLILYSYESNINIYNIITRVTFII